jgi:hypothetical protein
MSDKPKHHGWGGARKGSGRKSKGDDARKPLIVLRVTPNEHGRLKALAKNKGITLTEMLLGPYREE